MEDRVLRLVIEGLEPLLVNPGVLRGVQTAQKEDLSALDGSRRKLALVAHTSSAYQPSCIRTRGRRRRQGRRRVSQAVGAVNSPFLGRRHCVCGRAVLMVVPGHGSDGDGGRGGGGHV